MASEGWSALFWAAFRDSRNAMALVDEARWIVDVNGAFIRLLGWGRDELVGHHVREFVHGGPRLTAEEWAAALARQRFSGEAEMLRRLGGTLTVNWGATTEIVTGRRLVLIVAMSTSRRGVAHEHDHGDTSDDASLSDREREIVRLVALGRTGPEIADELHISHHTVRSHVRNSMTRLGARSRAHLVAKVLAEGRALD
jgi:PAS domain S-box-containing protein